MSMVEWKTIKELCCPLKKAIIKQGNLINDGCYPVINSGISLYGYFNEYNNDGNAFTFASRGEYAGFVTYVGEKFWAGGLCYPYRSKQEDLYITKYIYQYLKSKERNIMDTLVMRGGIPALNKVDVEKISIPIPSKSEQERIVSILDTFTSSISNLKEQIKERRKQYEYYRDQLLDLEGKDGVEMKLLNESCIIQRGIRVVKKDLMQEGTIPVFQNSIAPMGYYDKSNFPANVAYIICAGSSSGSIGFCTVPFWAADDCLCVCSKDDTNNKFIYHYLHARYPYIKTKVRGGAMPRLSRQVIENLKFPIIPFQEQLRIVTILDQFEASIANLEAQLKEREKQYEYYRNQLLTFE